MFIHVPAQTGEAFLSADLSLQLLLRFLLEKEKSFLLLEILEHPEFELRNSFISSPSKFQMVLRFTWDIWIFLLKEITWEFFFSPHK